MSVKYVVELVQLQKRVNKPNLIVITDSSGGSETASQGSSVPSSPPPPAGQVEENPEDEAAKSLTLLRSMLEPDPPATTASTVSETQCSATPNSCLTSSPPVTPTPMPAAIECVQNILADGSAVAGGLTLGQLLGKAAEEARQGGEEEEDEEEKARRKKKKQEAEEQEEKRSQQEQEEEAKRKEEEEHARERSTKGWTAQEAGLMTIGELYLMVGVYGSELICLHWASGNTSQKL